MSNIGSGAAPCTDSHFELRFNSVFNPGRALSFPCSQSGVVDMDDLPQQARVNYLYARAMVGREYDTPHVVLADGAH